MIDVGKNKCIHWSRTPVNRTSDGRGKGGVGGVRRRVVGQRKVVSPCTVDVCRRVIQFSRGDQQTRIDL